MQGYLYYKISAVKRARLFPQLNYKMDSTFYPIESVSVLIGGMPHYTMCTEGRSAIFEDMPKADVNIIQDGRRGA